MHYLPIMDMLYRKTYLSEHVDDSLFVEIRLGVLYLVV